jgi:signal transduction histidine kinase
MKRVLSSPAEDRTAGVRPPRTAAVQTNGQAESSSHMIELETELALYRSALEQAREEMQSFAYSVSHDLRAPLRAIEGFSKILLEDFSAELSEDARRYLHHVVANAQQLGLQIEDLLRFYRAGKNPPNCLQVDADAICQEAIVEAAGGKKPQAAIEKAPLPRVQADPVQLRQIFTELIRNALKAVSQRPDGRIEIGFHEEPNAVTFFVRDNGIGFEQKNADRLFKVFQKLHTAQDFPGNGIGLAIVKRLVNAHGGCVSAEAVADGGATFSFSLPPAAPRRPGV